MNPLFPSRIKNEFWVQVDHPKMDRKTSADHDSTFELSNFSIKY